MAKKSRKKVFHKLPFFLTLILLFLVGSLLLYGYTSPHPSLYLAKKTPPAPSNPLKTTPQWKTYKNDLLGVEFRYPNAFFNLQIVDETDTSVTIGFPSLREFHDPSVFFSVTSGDHTNTAKLPTCSFDTQHMPVQVPCLTKQPSFTLLSGRNVERFDMLESKTRITTIQTTTPPYIQIKETNEYPNELFKNILSTMKFTHKN